MSRIILTVLAAGAASGAAQAQLSYAIQAGEQQFQHQFIDGVSPDINDRIVNLDPYFDAPADLQASYTSADHALIEQWDSSFSGSGEATSDRFSIMASSSITGSLSRSVNNQDEFANTFITTFGGARIEVLEEVEVEISFDFSASGYDPLFINNKLEVVFTLTSELGSFTDFTAGFGGDAAVTSPFSITTTFLKGDVIDAFLEMDNLVEGNSANPGLAFDQSVSGAFTIEVIPAPGATALFGLAGLTAARRRR